jgi:hypothetical protein
MRVSAATRRHPPATALPVEAWERRIQRAMVDVAARRRDGAWSKDMEGIHERYAKTVKKLREQGVRMGMRQGRAKGGVEGLAPVVEARLGRRLKRAELATLRAKVSTLGPARAARVVVGRDPDALVAWLTGA